MVTEPVQHAVRRVDDADQPTATLGDVDISSELWTRSVRRPDYERENRAFASLALEMSKNPRNMLQKLVEVAVELCRAGTAGISLLEGDVFRWEAVAGVFASYRNGTMPRTASPCGICIDRDASELMHLPDRCFPALRADPRFVEALLIPFHFQDRPVGTVWIVAHSEERKFDRTDERVLRALSEFASAGWQMWKARDTAEEASRRKDEFLAMLGHELRNPLAAIVSAVGILTRKGAPGGSQRAVEILLRQSHHLTRMVEDLVDLCRISQGKLALKREQVELKSVVADAVETTRERIERRGHQLSVELPPEPIWLEADALRLAQVLTNLLDNAAKYTPEKGQIQLRTWRENDQLLVSVRDTGIGIPRERLDSVFNLFEQLGSSLDPSAHGLGVGLSLVRGVVELHGGSIVAASEGVGTGSEFTLRLPLSPKPLTAAVPSEPPTSVALPPSRILLVEDHEDLAESLSLSLSFDGHSVRAARDGPSALEALKSFEPDIVLLDLGLPGMDGYEVARQMRGRCKDAITIVALTGYGQDHGRRQTAAAGFDAHLVKPIELDELRHLLADRAAIGRRSGALTTAH